MSLEQLEAWLERAAGAPIEVLGYEKANDESLPLVANMSVAATMNACLMDTLQLVAHVGGVLQPVDAQRFIIDAVVGKFQR